jgi:hypothetical protein
MQELNAKLHNCIELFILIAIVINANLSDDRANIIKMIKSGSAWMATFSTDSGASNELKFCFGD